MSKTIYLGADHGGFELKEKVKSFLSQNFSEYTVQDFGCFNEESVDYPEFGRKVGEAVVKDTKSLGIVCCGSGVGIGIAVNKVAGARCVTANSVELATLGRQHNGAQVLSMGCRTQFINPWEKIVKAFLVTEMDMSDRHARRRAQLDGCGC